ncbi:MAG: HK97 gp10 family phage protein [Bdellovibrionales bacterium]
MADKPFMQVAMSGGATLCETLNDLEASIKKPAIENAQKLAMDVVRDEAESIAKRQPFKDTTGRLAGSFVTGRLNSNQRKGNRRAGKQYSTIISVGSTDPKAHLIEFGHIVATATGQNLTTGQKVSVTYRTRRFPILRPAWDSKSREVLTRFERVIYGSISEVVRKGVDKALREKRALESSVWRTNGLTGKVQKEIERTARARQKKINGLWTTGADF